MYYCLSNNFCQSGHKSEKLKNAASFIRIIRTPILAFVGSIPDKFSRPLKCLVESDKVNYISSITAFRLGRQEKVYLVTFNLSNNIFPLSVRFFSSCCLFCFAFKSICSSRRNIYNLTLVFDLISYSMPFQFVGVSHWVISNSGSWEVY